MKKSDSPSLSSCSSSEKETCKGRTGSKQKKLAVSLDEKDIKIMKGEPKQLFKENEHLLDKLTEERRRKRGDKRTKQWQKR